MKYKNTGMEPLLESYGVAKWRNKLEINRLEPS